MGLLGLLLIKGLIPPCFLPGGGLSLQGLCKALSCQMLFYNTWLVQVLTAILENSIYFFLPWYVLDPSGVANVLG